MVFYYIFNIYFIVLALFGNKADLVEQTQVDEEEVMKFATENGLIYKRTSALTGEGINETILDLIKKYLEHVRIPVDSIKINNNKGNSDDKGGCCKKKKN